MGLYACRVSPAEAAAPPGPEGFATREAAAAWRRRVQGATRVEATPAMIGRLTVLLVAGKTYAEAADDLGVTKGAVSALAVKAEVRDAVKQAFEQRRNAVARELDGATLEALRYLRATLGDTLATTKERIKCATELLDRGGFPRGVKLDIHNESTGTTIEIENVNALTDAEIEIAARAALERRARIVVAP